MFIFLILNQVGLPVAAVAQKMMAEGVVPTIERGVEVLGMDPEGPPPSTNSLEGDKGIVSDLNSNRNTSSSLMGPPMDPKKAMMEVIAKRGAGKGGLESDKNGVSGDINEGGKEGGRSKDCGKVPLREHPSYSKYFKMLKVGLPKETVKFKMEQEGVNADVIDRDPSLLVPLVGPKDGQMEGQTEKESPKEEAGDVSVSDHPQYSRYRRKIKIPLC
jgi:hypothetical protein